MTPSPYDLVWSHIDECAECNRDLSRLCRVGRERLELATSSAAERIAPMPWTMAKVKGLQ
jgi:hypothetical protein